MLTNLLRRLRGERSSQPTSESTVSTTATTNTSGTLYSVTIPGQEAVLLRAQNQVEVKRLVRDAQGLTRLPAGTTVERLS